MKIVVQRVKEAEVKVDGNVVGKIGKGFLVLLGVTHEDTKENADYLVKKLCKLRVFKDENDKMNLALKDINGKLLIVSQFTLYADCSQGNRPSFIEAAKPDKAEALYEYFCEECSKNDINSSMIDITNVPNPFQDTLRYGKLNKDELEKRIIKDVCNNTVKCDTTIKIAYTHINEYPVSTDTLNFSYYLSNSPIRNTITKIEKN